MSTGVIITLIVIAAAVVVVAAVLILRTRGERGGSRGLRRRFGSEYDRAVARHDGDEKAAEHELAERVEKHGRLETRPLEPEEGEEYAARWTAAQEHFVDSPREAVAEADRLLGELASRRGFPDGDRYDEQLDALSVHHAHHVHGYRRVHRAAHAGASGEAENRAGTEEMREAMIEARALFDDLVAPSRQDTGRTAKADGGEKADTERAAHARSRGRRSGGRVHLPSAFTRRHAKGS
ncbi:hypothetical protein [Streptomyces sp. NPDC002845]